MSNQAEQTKPWLTDDQVTQYHRDGYLVVENLLAADEALAWKDILKARLAEEGKLDEPSGVRVWMPEMMDAYTRTRMLDAKMLAILQQLIGPNVEFLSVKAVFKNAKTNFNSPWHQDWFYWQGTNKISVWIALDDATPENGCLRLVPGSHRQVFDKVEVDDGHGFGHRVSDEALHGWPIETVPVRRGDAVFFHDLALHGSCPNINGQERWSAIATYRDASRKDGSTVWRTAIVLSGQSVNLA
jgi:ectoine hydroxylase-related dioxygenase (phytanoyl-CoA dioxygenase family)